MNEQVGIKPPSFEALQAQKATLSAESRNQLREKLEKQEQQHREALQRELFELESKLDEEMREKLQIQNDAYTQHLVEMLREQVCVCVCVCCYFPLPPPPPGS